MVIPVYNSEKFLSEAIKSVLNQTYQNIEILAINDGSTDNSLEILKIIQIDILSKLEEKEKIRYQKAFQKYVKRKPLKQKTLQVGLKLLKNYFPENISNQLLVFYLNHIRRRR